MLIGNDRLRGYVVTPVTLLKLLKNFCERYLNAVVTLVARGSIVLLCSDEVLTVAAQCAISDVRGCYMPDGDPAVIMVRTRRELKEAIAEEIYDRENMVGLSKRAIAAFAALCWREAHKKNPAYLPHCLPCHDRSVRAAKYSYGIFCSVASRAEYLERTTEG